MSDFYDPPAITSEAEDHELEKWAHEAKAAIEAGKKAGMAMFESYKDAGKFLLKARTKCKWGEWLKWLRKYKIDRTTAWRALRAASNVSPATFEESELRQFAEQGEEQEKPDPSAPKVEKKFCSRPCRLGVGPAKCKECAKLNKVVWTNEEPPETKPETAAQEPEIPVAPVKPTVPSPKLSEILAQAEVYGKLAKRAKQLSKRIRQVERSEIYRMVTGLKTERLADAVLNVSTALIKAEPKEPCPVCGGASVNASKDSDPCEGCNGNAVLTFAQLEKRKQELNF